MDNTEDRRETKESNEEEVDDDEEVGMSRRGRTENKTENSN